MLERELTKEIIRELRHHCLVWREYDLPHARQHPKPCDLYVLIDGTFIAIEIKRFGGELKDHQREFLENTIDNGGKGLVLWFADENIGIEDLEDNSMEKVKLNEMFDYLKEVC